MKATSSALILCGLIAGLAGLDLQVGLRGDLAPVPQAEMAEGVSRMKAVRRPGDVLVHSPLFSVAELKAFGDLQARPDRPRPEVLAARRVLLLDRAQAPMFGPKNPAQTEAIGEHLVLKVFEPSGDVEVPVFDLLTDLGPNVLRIERPVGVLKSRCTKRRAEGGWSCPGEAEWLYAAPRTLRIGGKNEECVWAHPTTGGAVVFTLPAPEAPAAGQDLVLELSGGMADDAVTGTPGGATVTIQATQGSKKIGRLLVPNKVGWHRLELSLEPGAPVDLSITTPRDGRRHHCVNARIVLRPQDKP